MAKDIKDLSYTELFAIVERIFDAMFLDREANRYDPELEVNGGDLVDEVSEAFESAGVTPPELKNRYPYEYAPHEDCKQDGTHLTSCDEDGYCNFCGHHGHQD